ncbi:MAG TPA: hypothetical protein VHV51_10350 [Polyangiaceae bacterium]|jgi:hypothetical protein|nr:hypothetical protein [Polyangiaceae bacterium]
MNADYDESQWPILLVTLPERELEGAAFYAHIEKMSSFVRRGVPYVQLIDVRKSPSLSANSRRLVAERMDHDEEAYPGILLGVGIVLSTTMHRGIFKAMSWLTRRPRPFEAFTEISEATSWGRRLLNVPAHSMTIAIASDVSKRGVIG